VGLKLNGTHQLLAYAGGIYCRKNINFKLCSYHSGQNFSPLRLSPETANIRIYKTRILSAVMYGCETWSLLLREEQRTGNRLLGTFGPKREEVIGSWRKLNNEELL
jgi:hypothetical protein